MNSAEAGSRHTAGGPASTSQSPSGAGDEITITCVTASANGTVDIVRLKREELARTQLGASSR